MASAVASAFFSVDITIEPEVAIGENSNESAAMASAVASAFFDTIFSIDKAKSSLSFLLMTGTLISLS